jgi:carboxypeptidase family protein
MRVMRNSFSRYALSLCIFGLLSGLCFGQERFESGKYKGFTKYTAFAIVEREDPFAVREAKGTILRSNSQDPLTNVLVEFRNAGGKILSTKTDSPGQFRLRHLGEGTYMFKTTLNGFHSVGGTVIVQKSAKKSETITIEMPLGV